MSQFQEVKEVKGEEDASFSSSAGCDVNGKGGEKAPGYWFYSIGDFGFVCNELRETASAMDAFARANGAPKFVLGLGDNFYLHQDWRLPKGVVDPRFKNNWRDVFVCKKHLAQVPWYLILGNHDYESDYQCQIDYTFNKIENNDQIWNMPAQFYSRNFANLGLNLDLFAIDTNCVQDYVAGEHGCAPEIKDLLIPQKQWLRDEFAKVEQQNSDSWRIVIGHHCMYTQSKGHAATAVKLRDDYQMEAVLEEAGVDLYICGHEHVFQHHKPESGRVQHIVCGNSGADKRDGIGLYRGMGDTMKLDWFDRSNTHGFVAYYVKGDTITVSFVDKNGRAFKSLEINKERRATRVVYDEGRRVDGSRKVDNNAAIDSSRLEKELSELALNQLAAATVTSMVKEPLVKIQRRKGLGDGDDDDDNDDDL